MLKLWLIIKLKKSDTISSQPNSHIHNQYILKSQPQAKFIQSVSQSNQSKS